ncbi:MAG TPA: DUF2190 domain-containing protein [Kiloniellaceae bacterium]|nr:DUF2190 domain-containing protein [Kiloniellaceae bacterium]
MSNPILIKTYTASGAVTPYRLMAIAANNAAAVASAVTSTIFGVSKIPANGSVAAGGPVDVALAGVEEVVLGGAVTAGDPVTSDANGAAVAAAPAAGVNNRIGGFALDSGVAGDIVPMQIAPGQIQG